MRRFVQLVEKVDEGEELLLRHISYERGVVNVQDALLRDERDEKFAKFVRFSSFEGNVENARSVARGSVLIG